MAKDNIGTFTRKALEEITAGKTVSISDKDEDYKLLYRVVSEDKWYVVLLSDKKIPRFLEAEVQLGKERVLLVKPITYMNLSGECVGNVVRYYQVPLEDVLVVFDEVQLELGRLRLRPGGSAGGHNGVESVIKHLSTEQFPRLRLGVGAAPEWMDMMSYVLGVFPRGDQKVVRDMIERAVLAAETWVVLRPHRDDEPVQRVA